MTSAAIIVDVQNDFCEGGSLAVAGGAGVAAAIGAWLDQRCFDHVVATRDYHIDPGAHFSSHPDYAGTWPAHCVVGTQGSELHRNLDTDRVEAIFDKGRFEAAYSGFQGTSDGIGLLAWLRARGVDAVEIVGLATDYCVRATALDAVANGFTTTVALELTAGVARASVDAALTELSSAGVAMTGTPIVAR